MTIKITCNNCDTIDETCTQAVKLAIKNNENVVFEFNGVELIATPKSDSGDLRNEYIIKYDDIIFNDKLVIEFINQINQNSLLLQYLGYDSKNNKQKLN